jgi:hypothetical protein
VEPPFAGCPAVVLGGVVAVEGGAEASVPVVCAPPPVVWERVGGPATDTVLVAEPQPPTNAPAEIPSATTIAERRLRLIAAMVFAVGTAPPRQEGRRDGTPAR